MSHTPTSVSVDEDAYSHYARCLIRDYHAKLQSSQRTGAASVSKSNAVEASAELPIGILGAGAGGLYTAMILDDLGIPYKILEAKKDVGGRLFTYQFKNPTGEPYNYYDVGAMRFPRTGAMNRVFNLFDGPKLNSNGIALGERIKPYYFTCDTALLSYNGVTVPQQPAPSPNTFKASDVIEDIAPGIAEQYISTGTDAIVNNVIAPFAKKLLEDLETGGTEGWEKLKEVDKYSTRAYMSLKYEPDLKDEPENVKIPPGHLPTDVVNWCETFDKSTGWYDRALSETVLEAIAFGWTPPNQTKKQAAPSKNIWHCVDGGVNQIAQAMLSYLKNQNKRTTNFIEFESQVNYIGVGDVSADGKIMEVGVCNSDKRHRFAQVISTIPLTVLRTIDLAEAKLTPMQSNALRQLDYGPSLKIGMQFRTAWWTTGVDSNGNPLNIIGGQTFTDRPLRTIVYPSFGDVAAGKTTTLIASYCWTEDSSRLGALINNNDAYLEQFVLKELADIHNVTPKFLKEQLLEMHAWCWAHDPYTMGAFAFFGPGKFGNVYTSLTKPAGDNLLHFAGEALSVRHAWVEGALDSAWRAVSEMLMYPPYENNKELKKKFTDNWGANPEWIKKSLPKDEDDKGKVGGMFPSEGGAGDIFSPSNSLLYEHIAVTEGL